MNSNILFSLLTIGLVALAGGQPPTCLFRACIPYVFPCQDPCGCWALECGPDRGSQQARYPGNAIAPPPELHEKIRTISASIGDMSLAEGLRGAIIDFTSDWKGYNPSAIYTGLSEAISKHKAPSKLLHALHDVLESGLENLNGTNHEAARHLVEFLNTQLEK